MRCIDRTTRRRRGRARRRTSSSRAFDLDERAWASSCSCSRTPHRRRPRLPGHDRRRRASCRPFDAGDQPALPADDRQRGPDRPRPPRGHGVFVPRGTTRRRRSTSTTSSTAVDGVQTAHPDMYVDNAGVSTEKALDEVIGSPARQGGPDRRPAHDPDPGARPRLADVRRWCPSASALTAVLASMGLTVRCRAQIVPMDHSVNEVILLVGLAVGVDYSLFYMRRERDERRAGRSDGAPCSRRRHLRSRGPDLRHSRS